MLDRLFSDTAWFTCTASIGVLRAAAAARDAQSFASASDRIPGLAAAQAKVSAGHVIPAAGHASNGPGAACVRRRSETDPGEDGRPAHSPHMGTNSQGLL